MSRTGYEEDGRGKSNDQAAYESAQQRNSDCNLKLFHAKKPLYTCFIDVQRIF